MKLATLFVSSIAESESMDNSCDEVFAFNNFCPPLSIFDIKVGVELELGPPILKEFLSENSKLSGCSWSSSWSSSCCSSPTAFIAAATKSDDDGEDDCASIGNIA